MVCGPSAPRQCLPFYIPRFGNFTRIQRQNADYGTALVNLLKGGGQKRKVRKEFLTFPSKNCISSCSNKCCQSVLSPSRSLLTESKNIFDLADVHWCFSDKFVAAHSDRSFFPHLLIIMLPPLPPSRLAGMHRSYFSFIFPFLFQPSSRTFTSLCVVKAPTKSTSRLRPPSSKYSHSSTTAAPNHAA